MFLSLDDNCLSSITGFLGRDAHLCVGTLTCACRALQRSLDAREPLWSDLLTTITGSTQHRSHHHQQSHRQSKRLRQTGKAKFLHQLSARSDRSVLLVVGCTADLSRGQLTCGRLKKRLGELEVLCGVAAELCAMQDAVFQCLYGSVCGCFTLLSRLCPAVTTIVSRWYHDCVLQCMSLYYCCLVSLRFPSVIHHNDAV